MKPDDFPVFPSAFLAGLVTRRFHATWDFYTERLGFRTVAEDGSSVRLLHPGGAQLVLLRDETGDTPPELVGATEGRGFWLMLEVADPGAERVLLESAGVTAQDLPAAGRWRTGAFALHDPNGVLVIIAPRASRVRKTKPAAVEAPAAA